MPRGMDGTIAECDKPESIPLRSIRTVKVSHRHSIDAMGNIAGAFLHGLGVYGVVFPLNEATRPWCRLEYPECRPVMVGMPLPI